MPAHLKKLLFVLLATATLAACLARSQASQADTPAQKKAKEDERKALEAQKKKAADDLKKLQEIQKKQAIELQKALEKQAWEARKKQESKALVGAYLLLNAANSDAALHRNKAIHEVNQ